MMAYRYLDVELAFKKNHDFIFKLLLYTLAKPYVLIIVKVDFSSEKKTKKLMTR